MKKALLAILTFVFAMTLFAQVSADPGDEFYSQVQRWETLGLIKKQPPLRPYPVSVVEDILTEVSTGTNFHEAEAAKEMYEKYFKRAFKIKVKTEVNGKLGDDAEGQFFAIEGIDGDYKFPKYVSAGYKLDFINSINPYSNILPAYIRLPYYMKDGFELASVHNFMEVDGSIAGTFNDIYVQAGINHNSFGPFYEDSLMLSPTAKHTANFSFVINKEKWNYTQGLFILNATNGIDPTIMYPNKLLMMHSINTRLFKKVDVSFYESVIYGKRFDPSYMIPMLYMVTQGVTGYDDDNLFMGVTLEVPCMRGLNWVTDFYLDDVGFTGLATYHDIKLRCAAETGFVYVPEKLTWLEKVQLNYTMVSPYMYSHFQLITDYSNGTYIEGGIPAVNYQVYTTCGEVLGSSLSPNTGRIAFNADFAPVKGLKINIGGAFYQHGNISEGLTLAEQLDYLNAPAGYFTTDGGVNQSPIGFRVEDDGTKNTCGYLESAWNRFMFLTQDTLMYTIQAKAGAEYTFPRQSWGQFSIGLNYTFEYIKNYGVDRNIFEGTGTFENGVWEPGTCTEADVAAALENWRNGLATKLCHYLSINFKYVF